MADPLDLETGKPTGDSGEERGPGGRFKKGNRQSSAGGKASRAGRPPKIEAELRERFQAVFARISESLEGRDDLELATAIREEAAAMSGGIVSLTRQFTALRAPLLALLALIEPILAFGRVGRILLGRLATRRAQAAAEREMAQQEGFEQAITPEEWARQHPAAAQP